MLDTDLFFKSLAPNAKDRSTIFILMLANDYEIWPGSSQSDQIDQTILLFPSKITLSCSN